MPGESDAPAAEAGLRLAYELGHPEVHIGREGTSLCGRAVRMTQVRVHPLGGLSLCDACLAAVERRDGSRLPTRHAEPARPRDEVGRPPDRSC